MRTGRTTRSLESVGPNTVRPRSSTTVNGESVGRRRRQRAEHGDLRRVGEVADLIDANDGGRVAERCGGDGHPRCERRDNHERENYGSGELVSTSWYDRLSVITFTRSESSRPASACDRKMSSALSARHRRFVRSIRRRERVEHVGDGDDARLNGNVVAREMSRIAAPVQLFVMAVRVRRQVLQVVGPRDIGQEQRTSS